MRWSKPLAARLPASVAPTGTARRAQLEAAFSLCIHALVLIVCAFGAYWTMFSSFAPYDDEGYHLWVLRLFAAGHALYDSVFSYYGPFHYELWGGLSALSGVAFSTDTGRLVVWALWLGASLLLAITTRRLTGRLALAVIVQVLSFAVLAAFHYEPMYPGDTALVLVCGILAVAVFVLPARPRIALIAIGALVGAALLCKVNVGGYAAIAVGYAAVMSLPRMPWGRILRVAAIAAIVLVGPTVMTPTLNTGWTQRYAFLVAASAVGLVLATARSNGLGETAGADAQHWIVWLLSGLAGALALVIGVIFALGTTPRALYESVIVTASHQASVFAFPLPLTAVVLGWATAAVGLAWIVRRRPSVLVGHRRLGAVLRVLVGLVILCSVVGAFPLNIEPENARFALALPLAWVAALPSTRDDESLAGRFVRLVIPALAVMQALIAYPVSGSQMHFGSVLLLICGVVCVADGWSDLETSARDQPVRHRQAAPWAIMTSLTTALAIVFTVQYVVRPARSARLIYNSEQPLPFPGSRRLHLPSQQVAVFTSVVNTLRGRCRSVLTMPGMMSLNLWSALPAPSGMTQEPWWAVLSPAQLRVALARARAARGLCLVRDNLLVGFWLQGRKLPQIPLVRFVTDDFSQLAQYGTYVISAPITAGSPPGIMSVGPPNGASEVSPQTRVYAIFNRTMNRAATATSFSLVRTSDAQPVAGRIMFLVDDLPVLLPSKPLVPETRYTATISAAATDKVGNHLRVAKQWSFTTARP